jgi:DNA mismatch endonuclease (patch repair protein)
MKNIKSKDTKVEIKLRKALWHKGYRYRKNYSALPGKRDNNACG